MSAFNAFLTTWSDARASYGAGPATQGAEFDNSPQLQHLQTTAQSAAPQSSWTGSAADAYHDANTRHARTLGKFAGLDQRLGAEIDRSAATVTAGRTALDDVRQRAVDAANLTPNTTAGEVMRWQIASKGAAEIAEVMNKTSGDLSTVAERLRSLGDEYQALGKPGEDEPLNVRGPGDEQQGKLSPGTVDLDDIVYKKPGEPGPYGYRELVPGSGVWVPDPNGPMAPTDPPKHPVDLADIAQVGANERAPYGYRELIPGSGMYVPDPAAPNYSPGQVSNPLNTNDILYLLDGTLPPYGYDELYPGSHIYVPGPVGRSPGTTVPS